jgi:hypothetical protein
MNKNKKDGVCIHSKDKLYGRTYCSECIGGIKNIENFVMSEFVLEKVLE